MKRTIRVPFPRVRPFSPAWEKTTGLDWWSFDVVKARLPLTSLISTQRSVTLKGLRSVQMELVPRPISVVKHGRKYYIRDGHHRATLAHIRRAQTITCYLADLDTRGKLTTEVK